MQSEGTPHTPDASEYTGLWNPRSPQETSDPSGYYHTILEQYRIYVESAERTSQRRAQVNTFFLSFSTAMIVAITSYGLHRHPPERIIGLLILTGIFGFLLCIFWRSLLHSYRQINTAKFKVIGELESKLPASPFWRREWELIGSQDPENRRFRYTPLTKIEMAVPWLMTFAFVGIIAFGVYAYFYPDILVTPPIQWEHVSGDTPSSSSVPVVPLQDVPGELSGPPAEEVPMP